MTEPMHRGREWLALAALLPGLAGAAVRPVTLSYEVEPGVSQCPDERWVRQAVSARLGIDPFQPDAQTRVEVKIRKAAQGATASLHVTNRSGEKLGKREFTSITGDCLELAAATELAIAIAVDPHHLIAPTVPPQVQAEVVTVPSPAQAEVADAGVPPTPVAVVVPSTSPAARPGMELQAGLAAFGAVGLSPSIVPGLALAVRLQWRWLSLGVEGRADLGASVRLQGGLVTSSVLLASLVPCARFKRFDACAMAAGGALLVEGQLTSPPRHESSPIFVAGLRAAYEVVRGAWFSLRPFIEVQVVVTRTRVLSGPSVVWATAPVTGTLGLSFWFHLL